MSGYLGKRVAIAVLQTVAVLVLVYALTALLPGDTAVMILDKHAPPDQVAMVRQQLGLDEPTLQRFVDWLGGLLHGDLGTSLLTGQPVSNALADDIATTATLTALTLVLVIPLALLLGTFSGLHEGSLLDRALNAGSVLLHSIPEFVLALLLVGLFAVQLDWLPATAAGLPGTSIVWHPATLVLPLTVLVSRQLCGLARQVRIGVADASASTYATEMRLLGMPERLVVVKHVLPNALAPSLQQFARTVDGLLGGVVIVEAVFALGGMGAGFLHAVMARDLPLVQGYALVFAVTTVLVNLCADLAAHRLVPQREVRW